MTEQEIKRVFGKDEEMETAMMVFLRMAESLEKINNELEKLRIHLT